MVLAQITITSGQISTVKQVLSAIGTVASLWAIMQRAITASRNKLHEIMTENANRTRDEIVMHVDAKFEQHENSAFKRLDDQDARLKSLEKQIGDLADVLAGRKQPASTQSRTL